MGRVTVCGMSMYLIPSWLSDLSRGLPVSTLSERERDRQRQTESETERDREIQREREKEIEKERETDIRTVQDRQRETDIVCRATCGRDTRLSSLRMGFQKDRRSEE